MPGISLQPSVGRVGVLAAHDRRAAGSKPAGRACRGAAARRTASSTSASSTFLPAYMTMTRCAVSATTARSWVIRITAVPSFFCRSRIRSRICAWIVTSSAVVGSSAISTRGLQASAIAIIARCRMPPDSWCGYSLARCAGSGILTSRSISMALSQRRRFRQILVQPHRLGDLLRRSSCTGFSEVIGSWKIIEISLPRTSRISASLSCTQILAVEPDRAADDAARRVRHQPHQRQRGHRLAAAGFADDRQRFAAAAPKTIRRRPP